jgi:hypothetical protein
MHRNWQNPGLMFACGVISKSAKGGCIFQGQARGFALFLWSVEQLALCSGQSPQICLISFGQTLDLVT